jgi:hypothetical protein
VLKSFHLYLWEYDTDSSIQIRRIRNLVESAAGSLEELSIHSSNTAMKCCSLLLQEPLYLPNMKKLSLQCSTLPLDLQPSLNYFLERHAGTLEEFSCSSLETYGHEPACFAWPPWRALRSLKLGKGIFFPKVDSAWLGLRESSKTLSTFWLTGEIFTSEAMDLICNLGHQRGEHGLKELKMRPEQLSRELIDTLYMRLPHLQQLSLHIRGVRVGELAVVWHPSSTFPFIQVRGHHNIRELCEE